MEYIIGSVNVGVIVYTGTTTTRFAKYRKYCEKLVRAGKPQSNDDKLSILLLSASFGVRDTNDRLNIAEMCCLIFLFFCFVFFVLHLWYGSSSQ